MSKVGDAILKVLAIEVKDASVGRLLAKGSLAFGLIILATPEGMRNWSSAVEELGYQVEIHDSKATSEAFFFFFTVEVYI